MDVQIFIPPKPGHDVRDFINDMRSEGKTRQEIFAEMEANCKPAGPFVEARKKEKAEELAEKKTSKEGKSKLEKDENKSQATILVELAEAAGELWHATGTDTAYATVRTSKAKEHLPVRGKAFKRWLAHSFFLTQDKSPSSQAIQDALTVLEGKAMFAGESHEVFIRSARHGDNLYLDLVNDKWQAVEIDADGWRVVDDCPVRFRRTKSMLPLPIPQRGGDIEELRQFVNVDKDEWPLLLAWLAAAIRPDVPFSILEFHGEQGSSKSTTSKVVRSLIDPNEAPLRSEPREPRDLMIAATNGWIACYDNLSYLKPWLSDCLCRLATGAGFSTRSLYTDDEEMIFTAMRPIILAGIEEVATRSDALDRSLVLELPRISNSKRMTEKEFWREFQKSHGRILGAVLDGVSAAIRNLPSTQIDGKGLPRMADFATWGIAAETGFGLEPGKFLEAYRENIESSNETALESSPVASFVIQLIESSEEWKGTSTELLTELEKLASEKIIESKSWPKSARPLSGILKRLAPNFRAAGIEVEFKHQGRGNEKKRTILISRKSGDASGDANEGGDANDESGDANAIDENPTKIEVGTLGTLGTQKNGTSLVEGGTL